MIIIQGRNIITNGVIIPVDPDPEPEPQPETGVITIDVTLSNVTGSVSSGFTTLKYDKKTVLNLQKDDGGDGDYKTVFNWLHKGLNEDGSQGIAPTYTDGCGNAVKWRYGFAVPTLSAGGGHDLHDGANPFYATWPQYAEMAAQGWTMLNHSYGSGDGTGKDGDREFQIKQNEIKFYNELLPHGIKCRTRHIVIPDTQQGYTSSGLSMGYKTISSTFGIGSSDGMDNLIKYGGVDLNTSSMENFLLLSRFHFGDEWNDALVDGEAALRLDDMFDRGAGKAYAVTMFSHGPGTHDEPYEAFQKFTGMVKNHPKNNDTLWIPSTGELWDYIETKRYIQKTETMNGNVLRITLNAANIPSLNEFRDVSLKVSGATITNITVTGADSHSFNPSTGLINIFKRKTDFPSPELDARPSRLMTATPSGNSLLLEFDRPISQSMVNAWSVQDNTVTGLTGSSTNWTLQLSSPTSLGKTLNYKMQSGNALDLGNGLKVCSYINWIID